MDPVRETSLMDNNTTSLNNAQQHWGIVTVCSSSLLVVVAKSEAAAFCPPLVQAVKYQPKNLQAWNLLGLCQTSMGDIGDGIRAYQKAINLQPNHREAWVNMAQARKEVSPHYVPRSLPASLAEGLCA